MGELTEKQIWDIAIRDAQMGLSPVPITLFPEAWQAEAYARANSKALSKQLKRKGKEFFGDVKETINPTRPRWTEDWNHNTLFKPGTPRPGAKWY